MKVTLASPHHYPEIYQIYNWAIQNTTATFDTEIKSLEKDGKWFEQFQNTYPLLVITEGTKVAGFGLLKAYSDRKAYNRTVELSIYIDPSFHGKGFGSLLMEGLIQVAKKNKFHTILSRIETSSVASIKLHERYGFNEAGILKEVGTKFGKVLDVAFYQKILD